MPARAQDPFEIYVYEYGTLPPGVDLGLIAEFGFQNTMYGEDSRHLELRPIIGKNVGKLEVVFNPVLAPTLHGPGVRGGWGFEPAARFAYEIYERLTPSLEYYSSTVPFPTGPIAQKSRVLPLTIVVTAPSGAQRTSEVCARRFERSAAVSPHL